MTSIDESRLLNKLDNDYESNRSKMWYMTLRKALMILKADLTTKSSKMNELDDCLSRLKNPAYQLIFDLASEKMRDVTKRLEDFFIFFEDYNKLERMCETLVLVTQNEKTDEQPPVQSLSQPLQMPQPLQVHPPLQPVQMVHPPSQPTPQPQAQPQPQPQPQPQLQLQSQPQPVQLVQPQQQQLQLPPSTFNTLSLTPKASHNQSPLSTPIRSFLISTTDLFEDLKTPEKILSSSSPFSSSSLSTPKASTSDSLSTPIASYRQRSSFVVKDLMKEFKTPVKQVPPPSPLSVIIASSEIPMLDFNLSPTRSPLNHSSSTLTTTTNTNNTPSITTNNSTSNITTTTVATISKELSPSMTIATLPRGVLKSKRVSLEKFQHYNSIGLKRRAESAPVKGRQQQLRKLAPKTIIDIPSSTQSPLTTQFLKTMNVDQFLSKIHDENDKL